RRRAAHQQRVPHGRPAVPPARLVRARPLRHHRGRHPRRLQPRERPRAGHRQLRRVARRARPARLAADGAGRRGSLRSPLLARPARLRRPRLPAAVEPQPPRGSHRRGRPVRAADRRPSGQRAGRRLRDRRLQRHAAVGRRAGRDQRALGAAARRARDGGGRGPQHRHGDLAPGRHLPRHERSARPRERALRPGVVGVAVARRHRRGGDPARRGRPLRLRRHRPGHAGGDPARELPAGRGGRELVRPDVDRSRDPGVELGARAGRLGLAGGRLQRRRRHRQRARRAPPPGRRDRASPAPLTRTPRGGLGAPGARVAPRLLLHSRGGGDPCEHCSRAARSSSPWAWPGAAPGTWPTTRPGTTATTTIRTATTTRTTTPTTARTTGLTIRTWSGCRATTTRSTGATTCCAATRACTSTTAATSPTATTGGATCRTGTTATTTTGGARTGGPTATTTTGGARTARTAIATGCTAATATSTARASTASARRGIAATSHPGTAAASTTAAAGSTGATTAASCG